MVRGAGFTTAALIRKNVMSRAFVREPDGDQVVDDLPELPQEPIPNYVTPEGLEDLEARRDRLRAERDELASHGEDMVDKSKLAHVKRDLRYVEGRIGHAVVVDPAAQPRDEVAFGAWVDVKGEDGQKQTWRIVGEDQSDVDAGLVSWVSPLARALNGGTVGDVVTWKRPAGDLELEILAIRYA
jgi:transcription elongation factor GreB